MGRIVSALDLIKHDIEKCLDSGLCYAALVTALTIPHVCGALEADDGRANGVRYKHWYRDYVQDRFRGIFSAEACYSLRCGTTHQGQVNVVGTDNISRIVFRLPGESGWIHGNRFSGDDGSIIVQFELRDFCSEFVNAMDEWWKKHGASETVQANLPKLVRCYEHMNFVGMDLGVVFA